jgi:hypothetical protein
MIERIYTESIKTSFHDKKTFMTQAIGVIVRNKSALGLVQRDCGTMAIHDLFVVASKTNPAARAYFLHFFTGRHTPSDWGGRICLFNK